MKWTTSICQTDGPDVPNSDSDSDSNSDYDNDNDNDPAWMLSNDGPGMWLNPLASPFSPFTLLYCGLLDPCFIFVFIYFFFSAA
ncbi:GH14534 [Drosophila grimshawi]|uniref:GH14534 n=1 Tax=Drosophila grimshawi TaxID=7222 RepID=B4IZ17_DROGR|nr:GH14534 [Drosophila grimshawi]